MTNYCTNIITITAKSNAALKQLNELRNILPETNWCSELLFFSILEPEPDDINNRQKIDWRIANWGSESDLLNVSLTTTHSEFLKINCQTIETPIIEGLTAISKKFPFLKIECSFENLNYYYKGTAQIKCGYCTDEWSLEACEKTNNTRNQAA